MIDDRASTPDGRTRPVDHPPEDLSTRLGQVLEECLRRRAAGESLSDAAVVAGHPELMPHLGQALQRLRLIDRARLDAAQPSPEPPDRSSLGDVRLQCPHCQAMLRSPADESWSAVTCSACGAGFSLVDDSGSGGGLRAGDRLGRFELQQRIGSGGFGAVWKGRDTRLERVVALKVPRRGELSDTEQEMFLREARAAAQVRHPHVVSIHEVGREAETIYLVSDFVEGASLAAWLRQRRPPIAQAAVLARQIAEALQHIHDAGIVHRDLKPANILVREEADGRWWPYVTDFGLARRASEVTLTADGQLLGTPAYMSPEQAAGGSHAAGPASDVYSLGVVLFELLTGEAPFRGSPTMVVDQVLHDEPISPRKLNGRVPRDLETIVLKCLEKDPARRYATAAALADDLGRWQRGEPIWARPLGRSSRAVRWCRRKPLAAALAGVFALLAVGGPIVAIRQFSLAETAASAAARASAAALQAREAAADKARNLYAAHMIEVQQSVEAGEWSRAIHVLRQELPAVGQPDLRSFEWHYWWSVCHDRLQHSIESDQAVAAADLAPDGRFVAYSRGRQVVVWEVDRDSPRRELAGHRAAVVALAFSADGAWLASGDQAGQIVLWDFAARQERAVLSQPQGACRSLVWSRDGARLAALAGDRSLAIWNVGQRRRERVLSVHGFPLEGAAFSADGARIAVSSRDQPVERGHSVTIFNLSTGERLQNFGELPRVYSNVCWSVDGKWVATGGFGSITLVEPARPGFITQPPHSQPGPTNLLCFSADGSRAFAANFNGALSEWDLSSQQLLHAWPAHVTGVGSLAVSADGRRLATAGHDRAVRVWSTGGASRAVLDSPHRDSVISLAFSRDGRQLYTSGFDGRLCCWDTRTGATRYVRTRPAALGRMALTGDGRRLATIGAPLDPLSKCWGISELRIWDAGGDCQTSQTIHNPGPAAALAWSPDGNILAVGCGNWSEPTGRPRSIYLYDVARRRLHGRLAAQIDVVEALVFSHDGRQLVSAGLGPEVLVWDAAGLRRQASLMTDPNYNVVALALSPDGATLAAGTSIGAVWLWKREPSGDFRFRAKLDGPSTMVLGLAFSPDGKTLAAAMGIQGASKDNAGAVRLWDTATWQVKTTLRTAAGRVLCAAFSPDSRMLAAGHERGTVYLWRGDSTYSPSPAKR